MEKPVAWYEQSGSAAAAYKKLPVAQLVAASDGARKCSLAPPCLSSV